MWISGELRALRDSPKFVSMWISTHGSHILGWMRQFEPLQRPWGVHIKNGTWLGCAFMRVLAWMGISSGRKADGCEDGGYRLQPADL